MSNAARKREDEQQEIDGSSAIDSSGPRPVRAPIRAEERDFRLFLQREFMRRLRRNSHYTMRSFAQHLELNSGTLSQMLSGKRPIGLKLREKLMDKLELDPSERAALMGNTGIGVQTGTEAASAATLHELTLETFKVISDWHHFAILELLLLPDCKPSSHWIAKRLGLPVMEASVAVERLKRLGLIEIKPDGRWIPAAQNLSTLTGEYSDIALRRLQADILQKAIDSLENIPLELRDHSSLTIAVNVQDLSLIKQKITQFRRQMNQFLSQRPEPSDVYHLTIAFYPVTARREQK